jgi:hypothetical protein
MATVPDVVFHFDPGCPWTWMTSRWLVDVAGQRDLDVAWQPLSLKVLNGDKIPEQHRARLDATFLALRAVTALADAGDHEAAGRLYTALGDRFYRKGDDPTPEVVKEIVTVAAPQAAGALDDDSRDGAIAERTMSIVEAAGGDVGSPVLSFPERGAAIHGPIVNPPPTGDEAGRLWDAISAAVTVPGFLELKRGRGGRPPQL